MESLHDERQCRRYGRVRGTDVVRCGSPVVEPGRVRARQPGVRGKGDAHAYAPFDPLISGFFAYLRLELGRAVRTAEEYSRDVEMFGSYLAAAGDVPREPTSREPFANLLTASTSDIRHFVMHLMGEHKYSAVAVRRKIASLRAFYGLQKREGARPDNPAADVALPKAAKRLPVVLRPADTARLLRARVAGKAEFQQARDTAIIVLFYSSGIRREELRGLNMLDVDLATKSMRVTGKGNKQRVVFFTATAVKALQAYFARRPASAGEAVFIKSTGARLSPSFFDKLFRTMRAIAGVDKRVTPHVLRHSFATDLLEGGADLVTIKELLGHASLATTQIYTNVSAEHMRRTYEDAHPLETIDDI